MVIKPYICIGIDPGMSGGLAWISVGEKGTIHRSDPMPETRLGILKWFLNISGSKIPRYTIMEKVGGFMASSKDEDKKNMASGHTMFTFGKSVGWIEMAVEVCELTHPDQFFEVVPRVWQSALNISPRKSHRVGKKVIWDESKTDFKNRLKLLASSLFPRGSRPTAKTADALLIAEYCRRKVEGEI